MESEFERQWRMARMLENEGRIPEAQAIYEALLQADPDRLYVRMRLSVIEQARGDYRAARDHALRCADAVRTTRWKDLSAVTRRLLTFDEQDLACELILGADWQHPEIIRSSPALSQHLWLSNRVEQALALIQAAEARAMPSHLLHYSKGNVLRYLGRMDEAAEEYERCIALVPDFAYAHWSLASHRKASTPGARIARIECAKAGNPPEEQPFLDYALFREHDDAGHTERAWASLMSGATAKRASLAYDPQAEDAGFRMLEGMTAHAFEPTHLGDASPARVPIFILGMPRTGTTLLERILGGHGDVEAGGELNDFESALSLATNRFLRRYATPEAIEALQAADFAEVGRTYLQRTDSRTGGKRFLTDKNPANFVHAGFIAKALPDARILCLRREPMDACWSNMKELFANDAYPYSYDQAELADHYLRFDRLCTHWKAALPGRFLDVQYESLVTDTERVVREVLAFCGLPFQPECLDITGNTAPVATASSSQVRQPINTRGIGAWRKYETSLGTLRERLETGAHA